MKQKRFGMKRTATGLKYLCDKDYTDIWADVAEDEMLDSGGGSSDCGGSRWRSAEGTMAVDV